MKRVTKEEYIEAIFALQKNGKVQTGQIADHMDIKPPSVTEMLGKLKEEGLVEYEPYRVTGLNLDAHWIAGMLDHLAKLPLVQRRGIPGLESGREDIILGGTLVVQAVLQGLHKSALTVTDAGLLEGLLLHLLEGHRPPVLTSASRVWWRWNARGKSADVKLGAQS